MKAFVTGGTGFIGKPVIRKLLERGYQVTALVRSQEDAAELREAGAEPVFGDITNPASLRPGMAGSDVVFHIAGWYKLGSRNQELGEKINVEGTRNVLGLAYELGVPRIIYTSTVAVFGDTHGQVVDENTPAPVGPWMTEYDRTKARAHLEVAQPLIEKGAPVIIVMPGAVYGPGDPSLIGQMMRLYYKGLLAVFPAPDLTLTFAHVEDIAAGHLLAAEKGKPGETYILAGPAVPLGEMVKLWAEVTGKPAPLLYIPPQVLKPLAPLAAALGAVVPLPELISAETISILDTTYTARADKAKMELGWQTRPLEEGMRETFEWIARETVPPSPAAVQRRKIAGLALGAAIGLLLAWLFSRRREE